MGSWPENVTSFSTPVSTLVSDVILSVISCAQYLQDVNCPFGAEERQEAVDWLLGLAVRYEYGDNGGTSARVCLSMMSV